MSWAPGRPIATPDDHAEWQAWRKARILAAQREQRQRYPRIDYIPGKQAREAIARALAAEPWRTYTGIIDEALEAYFPE